MQKQYDLIRLHENKPRERLEENATFAWLMSLFFFWERLVVNLVILCLPSSYGIPNS